MKITLQLEVYEEESYDPPEIQVDVVPDYGRSLIVIHDGHGPDGGPSHYVLNTSDLKLLAHVLGRGS